MTLYQQNPLVVSIEEGAVALKETVNVDTASAVKTVEFPVDMQREALAADKHTTKIAGVSAQTDSHEQARQVATELIALRKLRVQPSQPPYVPPTQLRTTNPIPQMLARPCRPSSPSTTGDDSSGNDSDDDDSDGEVQIRAVGDNEDNIEILDVDTIISESVPVAGPSNLDVVLVSSPAKPSKDSQMRVKYLDRYNLVKPPFEEKVEHEKRSKMVIRYFEAPPRVGDDPTAEKIAIFRRVARDTRANPNWATEEVCPVCLNKSPPPKILLSCSCRHTLFHQSCIQQWHQKKDKKCQGLLTCPKCRSSAKPVHLAWVAPTEAEAYIWKGNKHKNKHKTDRERRKAEKHAEEAARRKAMKDAMKKGPGMAKAPGPGCAGIDPVSPLAFPTWICGLALQNLLLAFSGRLVHLHLFLDLLKTAYGGPSFQGRPALVKGNACRPSCAASDFPSSHNSNPSYPKLQDAMFNTLLDLLLHLFFDLLKTAHGGPSFQGRPALVKGNACHPSCAASDFPRLVLTLTRCGRALTFRLYSLRNSKPSYSRLQGTVFNTLLDLLLHLFSTFSKQPTAVRAFKEGQQWSRAMSAVRPAPPAASRARAIPIPVTRGIRVQCLTLFLTYWYVSASSCPPQTVLTPPRQLHLFFDLKTVHAGPSFQGRPAMVKGNASRPSCTARDLPSSRQLHVSTPRFQGTTFNTVIELFLDLIFDRSSQRDELSSRKFNPGDSRPSGAAFHTHLELLLHLLFDFF
ncbi:hypothetical protein B0H19DRAFT_1246475 [Mycena capillaripes]|nr:hypothetical protein B0H19DRAFT_1246475 [Mycena capillaripes]